ncbi:MAG: hypothetical protein R3E65_01905 [Steroidobacteraceae bacterium]
MRTAFAVACVALGLFATTGSASAGARWPAQQAPLDVEIYDRTRGAMLPVHRHRGELYAAGEPGHEYEIRLRSREHGRVLAVTSVDGVNVVSGETAATDQAGYVIGSWDSTSIDGWRKSLDDVAAFYFTRLRNSYAARTGRPDHVGVIGVAMFRERVAVVEPQPWDSRREAVPAPPVAAAPSAPAAAAAAAEASDATNEGRAERSAARQRLGTGHGERRESRVSQTRFERRSATPDAVVRIYYDSHERLVARGIIAEPPRHYGARPQPFPAGFVPDP